MFFKFNRLNACFIWYNKSENEIILSRDHAGIKPLYFGLVKSGLIFCSEIKGLLPHINGSSIIVTSRVQVY